MKFVNYEYQKFKKTVPDLFYSKVQDFRSQPALIHNHDRYNYNELSIKVQNFALHLKESCKLQKGDRIAFLLPNCKEFVIAYYAAMTIGAIAVPLNARLTPHEIRYQLVDSLPSLVIASEQLFQLVDKAIAQLPSLKKSIIVTIKPEDFESTGLLKRNLSDLSKADVEPNDPACIMYTSGTTGKPKGAMMSHWNIAFGSQIIKLPPCYKFLCSVPLFHVAGLNSCLNTAIANAGTSILIEKFKTDQALQLIEEEQIDFITVVPTILNMMVNSPVIDSFDLSSIKVIACGGAPLHLELLKKALRVFPEASFLQMFALTETSNRVLCMDCNENLNKLGSVGLPLPGIQTKIVDDRGNVLPRSKTGELVIKGPCVIKRYWNQPEGSTEAIIDDWLYTGDLARIDNDGYHYIMGRKKDMIIRGGENIYNVEVENVVRQHPKVCEAAVFGVPDDIYGEEVMAFVVLNEGETLSIEELYQFCCNSLAHYKIPKHLKCLKELPKNPAGKVMKAVLFTKNGFPTPSGLQKLDTS
jgi:long-chain acyl-CoA synthetase